MQQLRLVTKVHNSEKQQLYKKGAQKKLGKTTKPDWIKINNKKKWLTE